MILNNTLYGVEIFKSKNEKKIQLGLVKKNLRILIKSMILCLAVLFFIQVSAQTSIKDDWYTEGDFAPLNRIKITVTNPLNIELKDQPVVVERSQLPYGNIPERWVAVVDPNLPENVEPTREQLKKMSGYFKRKETNGHAVELQLDDIDKDGIWDEIFFMTNLGPKETRDFFIYFGHYERGLYPHEVHAATANYGRHTVPFMESKIMGWKLWYPQDLDLHGKRKPMLTAYNEYSTNLSGYYMPWEEGTDIMWVQKTFGAGGMCIFEDPNDPENPARAFYSPYKDMGPVKDSRFSYDVIANGPLRGIVKVSTRNWNSGKGFYEMDQYYTVIANKSYCMVRVNFKKFLPPGSESMFGAGIRKIMMEYKSIHKGGTVISMGKNVLARIPDESIGDTALVVPWEGIAMIVKDKYNPKYVAIKNWDGNHLFQIPQTQNLSYEYMALGGWSYGEVNNNEKDFVKYVETEGLKYNDPPIIKILQYEVKGK
ncbi:MAG: DUF4861 family protein [Ginsengibacter sp.]